MVSTVKTSIYAIRDVSAEVTRAIEHEHKHGDSMAAKHGT